MLLLYICNVLLLIISAIRGLLSIECFNCSNVLSLSECNSTVTCNDGQVCYKSHGKTDQIMYDFGCADKPCAKSSSQPQNVSEPFQADSCFECCSEKNCNKHLCEKLSVCKDKSLECALLNSTITICENAKEAKIICKKYCNLCHIVDGKWSKWSEWTKCDVTCGNGSLIRHRECDSPAPKHGGLECPGDGIDKKQCFAHLCPAHGGWSQWEDWGECSATCGVGMRSRNRSCTNPSPHRFGDHCFGNSIEDELCNNGSCAANVVWSQWENWGECSATCGVGMRSRKRSCTNPRSHRFGDHCFGNSIEDELCNKGSCAVNGGWGGWTQWAECSESCGSGLQSRTRTCTNPLPTNAGEHCIGQHFDVKLCYGGHWPNCLWTDCNDIQKHNGKKRNGVYNIRLWKTRRVIPVYCDFNTDSGGWTVFQYRFDGSVDFYRNFIDYEKGFGSLYGEFWLGLENIYEMVSQGKTELRLDLTAADGTSVYETFQNFRLGEKPYYTLYIGKGVGTAGDVNGLAYHTGRHFSSFDIDRDGTSGINCAEKDRGGWWYGNCAHANLNGEYVTPGSKRHGRSEGGMIYYVFKRTESLKVSKMMFRRV